MQNLAGRCLVELTTADAVFMAQDAATTGTETQDVQIAKLTGMLNRHVNGLIQGIIQFEIVEAFGRCICQHQISHARTDIIVKHFLTTIHNCLLYCSMNQKKLRMHLATQCTVVQDIMIPYVHNILPALYDNPKPGPSSIEWQNLKSTLQTFVVVTFNINNFRPQLRDADMIPRICQVPFILTHISMLELLIKLSINVDFASGPYGEAILQTLQGGFVQLPVDQQQSFQRRMTSEQSMRLPYNKANARSAQALAWALAPLAEDVGPAAAQAAQSRRAQRKNKWHHAKDKSRKRQRLLNMQSSTGVVGEDDDDEDDMPPLIPAGGWEASLGAAENDAGIPSKALCQLTGTLMADPVQTPEGNVFERAALEDWIAQNRSNPLTGGALTFDQCVPATALQPFIQGYQLQMFAASQIAPEAFDQPPVLESEPPPPSAVAVPPAPVTGPSLLGSIPSLAQPAPQKKKGKSKIHITSRSVVECPEEMRCGIDGKVMTQPMVSPYGHRFEKKTLEKWMSSCGQVCPITQKPMTMNDCQPDGEMKKAIVKFLKNEI